MGTISYRFKDTPESQEMGNRTIKLIRQAYGYENPKKIEPEIKINAQEFINHTRKVCNRLLKEIETIENTPSEMIRIEKYLEVKHENELFVELYEMAEQMEEME